MHPLVQTRVVTLDEHLSGVFDVPPDKEARIEVRVHKGVHVQPALDDRVRHREEEDEPDSPAAAISAFTWAL